MNPTFGCHLWSIVFEQNDNFIPEKVSKVIHEDIARWIPGVEVVSVNVKYFEDDKSIDLRDIYKLYIVVSFVIDSISEEDSVELTLDVNKV